MNPQPNQPYQYRWALFTALLAFCVILVGAYVRLSDAGLGCPDWPGCYGELVVPEQSQVVVPEDNPHAKPLHTGKAWKEMIHRYLAGTLGLMILLLAILAWRNRHQPDQPLWLPSLLLALVIFQALLGMWTVTLLVKPAIVTAHLLGGFATFVMLVLLSLRLRSLSYELASASLSTRRLAWIALAVLILQISLGGWTSTNYAALGCSAFPGCYADEFWPAMDFAEGFTLWRGLGINYEFGVLENDARAAIHMSHRIGALVTLLTLGLLIWRLMSLETGMGRLAGSLLILLLIQIGLGITNVLAHLPLPVAVAHNGVAALLLATLSVLCWQVYRHES